MDEKVETQLGKPATLVIAADTWHQETQVQTWDFLFCVRYYVSPSVGLTWDDDARHLFFLQLKDDVAQGRCVTAAHLRICTHVLWSQCHRVPGSMKALGQHLFRQQKGTVAAASITSSLQGLGIAGCPSASRLA